MINMIKQIFGKKPEAGIDECLAAGAVVVDVRSKGEFSSGHFPKAVNVPLPQLQMGALNLSKDKAIITCCASGMRSATAKKWLEAAGYTNVTNGGSWQSLMKYSS